MRERSVGTRTVRFLFAVIAVFTGLAAGGPRASAQETLVREPARSEVKAEKEKQNSQQESDKRSPRDKDQTSNTETRKAFNQSRFEFFVGYKYASSSAQPVKDLSGFDGDFSLRTNSWLSLRAEVGTGSGTQNKIYFHRQTLLFGPQLTIYSNHRMRAFLVALVGLVHDSSKFRLGTASSRSSASACIWALGGGLDVRLSDRISFRVIEILPNLFPGEWQNDGRITTGMIFHFGGKHIRYRRNPGNAIPVDPK